MYPDVPDCMPGGIGCLLPRKDERSRETLCAAIRGVAGKGVPMEQAVLMVAMAIGGVGAVVFCVWWQDRQIRRETIALHERVHDQDRTLTVVSAEIQYARSEVSRLQSELTAVRFAVESLIQGPPSMRRPPAPLS